MRRHLARAAQQPEGAVVVTLRPHAAKDGTHSLDVVVEYGGARVENGEKRGVVPLEVGDEHLDAAAGQRVVDALDALGENGRAAVWQVLSGDGGDDAVAEAELADGLGQTVRLPGVDG